MANLVSLVELRAVVPSPLDDTQLDAVVARVEAEITEIVGAPAADSTDITETLGGGQINVFTKRPIASITSITEYALLSDSTGTTLTEGTDFFVWVDEGRIERIGGGSLSTPPSANDVFYMSEAQFISGRGSCGWGQKIVVVYAPKDQTDRRKQAVIDLVRIVLSHTALQTESVAGEYRFEAPPNWEESKRQVLRRLQFRPV